MISKAQKMKQWFKAGLALASLATAAIAVGQASYHTLQGTNQRTGNNQNPVAGNPGRGILYWWQPQITAQFGATLIRDNVSPQTVRTGNWFTPSIENEASSIYLPEPQSDAFEQVFSGRQAWEAIVTATPQNQQPYHYAFTIPSAPGNNPLAQQNPGDTLSTFTWNVQPGDPALRLPRNYALYVWLPIGPTRDPVSGNPIYSQRFYAYEILFAGGGRMIDVVDVYQAGTGWVRLGGGGRPTNQLFPYDGNNPIQVRLYNTVPRNQVNGNLTDTPYSTVVYADALRASPDTGYYTATPIVSLLDPTLNIGMSHVVHARNNLSIGRRRDEPAVTVRGEVRSDNVDGTNRWRWSPVEQSGFAFYQDNNSAGVTWSPPWLPGNTAQGFRGPDYLFTPAIVSDPNLATPVVYAPPLETGSYDVFAWLPGSSGPDLFAEGLTYEVHEGTSVSTFTVNQHQGGGWVRIGSRRFNHDPDLAQPLRVFVTNHSNLPTDLLGRQAFADTIMFVGAVNLAIDSTPVQAGALVTTVPAGSPVQTAVTIVAAEDGRIYCLDSAGNPDGTTRVIWTYPSLPDGTNQNWTDPNHVAGEDGVNGVAQMPTGFDLSSALVQRIDGQDFLFIGSRNGRIYCIEMAGRGDMNLATGHPGTTRRVWTYPDDYPANVRSSALGSITGSITYADTPNGPTILVPTQQGRLYALDARAGSNKTTSVRWTFPPLTQQNLGPIVSTPAVGFGNVYFGTMRRPGAASGVFYAVNLTTGQPVWQFTGTPLWSQGGLSFVNADDFVSSPALADAAVLGGADPNMVFVANENRWITALRADNGTVVWTTDEIGAGVQSGLTFTIMNVFTSLGVMNNSPVVLVPSMAGRFTALHANSFRLNRFGTRRAWEYETAGDRIFSSIAVGQNWLVGADNAGFIYGFGVAGLGITPPPGPAPGRETVVEDDPESLGWSDAKIRFITREAYMRLRLPAGDPQHLTYEQAMSPAFSVLRTAFDWGETLYVLVHDFRGQPPAVINYSFSVEGAAVRSLSVESREFRPGGVPPPDPSWTGYATLAFTLQGGGSNALPPGNAQVQISLTTVIGGRQQNVALDPNNSRRIFQIANPLGVVTRFIGANPDPLRHIGWDPDPSAPENLVNGSPNIALTPKAEDRLMASVDVVAHGRTGAVSMGIVDRSLMTLLRGPGRGVDNVRIAANDLAWQGGTAQVRKPLPGLFAGFEDYPDQFPNVSLDYPDVLRQNIRAIKDIFGTVENPIFGAVSLTPPANVNELVDPPARTLVSTPLEVMVDMPRFQPPNLATFNDSGGQDLPGGYLGRMYVFVDSDGSGTLTRGGGRREAFRSFWTGGSVQIDERLYVDTPTVDLGSLAGGTGYSPLTPGDPGSTFSPWNGPYQNLFRSFTVRNDGNVNLLDLRVAKAFNGDPWPIFSAGNHDRAWLNARLNIHSDIDSLFALTPQVILQKPRVGDRVPTELTTNPVARPNQNLGTLGGPLLPNVPPAAPRVAASIPLGFPVGSYSQIMRVIEERPGDRNESLTDGLENYSDPTFTLKFDVRETRTTTTFTPNTAPVVDNMTNGNENFLYANSMPTALRDLQGNVVLAFVSDRDIFNAVPPTSENLNPQWRLYVASLNGSAPNTTNPYRLHDLNNFVPESNNRWFRRDIGPFPTQNPNDLFPGDPVVPDTARFGSPSFPNQGVINPFNTLATNGDPYLACVGEAQKQSPRGRTGDSRIFIARATIAGNGQVTLTTPVGLDADPGMPKGRPSLLQVGGTATAFYTVAGSGQSQIMYATFDGSSWGPARRIDVGGGFENVGAPSVHGRIYEGAGAPGAGTPIIEMSFTGKLRGRPHSEIFMGRMTSNGQGVPQQQVFLPVRQSETLQADAEPGTFRARGIGWNLNSAITLVQVRGGGAPVNLEVPGTRQINRQTGLITFDTVLGGRVYIDPNMGTVRFANTVPARDAELFLTYQPRFVRISTGGASHNNSSLLYDNRLVGDVSYWRNNLNAPASASDPIPASRFVLTYGRAATGGGQAARPFMHTVRFGVQLPTAVHTQPNGAVTNLSVSGANSFYQIDPANGRVYFTAADEARNVTITYTGADETTGQPIAFGATQYTIRLVSERTETPVPIEQAINESQMTTFIDPFDSTSAAGRRPGLIWMFWTSTRGGTADVFFQTIAPRFTPLAR
jgi:outer membrane protein assembly factor BamB